MRNALISLPLFLLLLLLAPPARAFHKPFRVVIDPGHGGADTGTIFGRGTPSAIAEKDVTLMLAKEVAKKLKQKGYAVLLTRDSDTDLSVPHRTALANKWGADAFLSIHMNSTPTPGLGTGEGIESYILNRTSDESSRRLAQLENMVLGPRGNTPEEDDVALILKDLRLDANESESKRLACAIQKNIVTAISSQPGAPDIGIPVSITGAAGRVPNHFDRGVKQALFYVLLGADMPSVLVEAGFLSSERDRNRVLSYQGEQEISGAIVQAIDQFRKKSVSNCKVN